jgi:hypothetical protein
MLLRNKFLAKCQIQISGICSRITRFRPKYRTPVLAEVSKLGFFHLDFYPPRQGLQRRARAATSRKIAFLFTSCTVAGMCRREGMMRRGGLVGTGEHR